MQLTLVLSSLIRLELVLIGVTSTRLTPTHFSQYRSSSTDRLSCHCSNNQVIRSLIYGPISMGFVAGSSIGRPATTEHIVTVG